MKFVLHPVCVWESPGSSSKECWFLYLGQALEFPGCANHFADTSSRNIGEKEGNSNRDKILGHTTGIYPFPLSPPKQPLPTQKHPCSFPSLPHSFHFHPAYRDSSSMLSPVVAPPFAERNKILNGGLQMCDGTHYTAQVLQHRSCAIIHPAWPSVNIKSWFECI